jgi:hypothetical protein
VWRGLDRKKQGTGIREQGSEKAEHRKKGTSGMGEAEGTGVLRCAQDDSKNKQHQEQKQIPFGDDNQEKQRQRTGNGKGGNGCDCGSEWLAGERSASLMGRDFKV